MTWGDPGDAGRLAERRSSDGRRVGADFAYHQRDPFAHPSLVDRLLEGVSVVRADYERRLRFVEQRVFALTVASALVLVLVGAVVGAVAARLLAK